MTHNNIPVWIVQRAHNRWMRRYCACIGVERWTAGGEDQRWTLAEQAKRLYYRLMRA